MTLFNKRFFRSGQPVVYCATKRSTHPGPRAVDVRPEECGEGYQYHVNKYWVVEQADGDQVVLLTRKGKRHVIDVHDPNLRPAGWLEYIVHADRFPRTENLPLQHSA